MNEEKIDETDEHSKEIPIRYIERNFYLKARRVRTNYEIDSKKSLEKMIQHLEELAEYAHKCATSKNLPTETRQKWARIEAHIYQTLNMILKTYDSQQIMEKLEELTKVVEELTGENKEPREEN